MPIINDIIKYCQKTWQNQQNRRLIIDVGLMMLATVLFHILYWSTDMNLWLFGPWTNDVFDFFTSLAFRGVEWLNSLFLGVDYECANNTFYFFTYNDAGIRMYNSTLMIEHDCSGVKQLLQWGLIVVLCRRGFKRKSVFFLTGCVILLICNILRIHLLCHIIVSYPEYFDFIHSWVARPMMYVIIFVMWAYLIKTKR